MPRYTRATFVSRLALTIAELIAWIVVTYPLPLHPSRKSPKPRRVSLYLTYLREGRCVAVSKRSGREACLARALCTLTSDPCRDVRRSTPRRSASAHRAPRGPHSECCAPRKAHA